jgi:G3E family GTPase
MFCIFHLFPGSLVEASPFSLKVQRNFMVDNVVALVDALHGLEKLDESKGDVSKGPACAQIAFSSTVLLNKIDLVDQNPGKKQKTGMTKKTSIHSCRILYIFI